MQRTMNTPCAQHTYTVYKDGEHPRSMAKKTPTVNTCCSECSISLLSRRGSQIPFHDDPAYRLNNQLAANTKFPALNLHIKPPESRHTLHISQRESHLRQDQNTPCQSSSLAVYISKHFSNNFNLASSLNFKLHIRQVTALHSPPELLLQHTYAPYRPSVTLNTLKGSARPSLRYIIGSFKNIPAEVCIFYHPTLVHGTRYIFQTVHTVCSMYPYFCTFDEEAVLEFVIASSSINRLINDHTTLQHACMTIITGRAWRA